MAEILIVDGCYTATQDPFVWDNGKMTDLGNLGGTFAFAQCTNNRGEVIGQASLPGDLVTHAFVWRKGRMKDLGTLGGDNSEAIWINDAGDIAGSADLQEPDIHDAVRWRHGQILDLGTVDGDACSRGRAINSKGQIVGGSSDCHNFLHAFVWEEGGPMLDLNTLIAPGSGLQLTNAFNINDRGEILAKSIPLDVGEVDLVFDVLGGEIAKRSAGLIRAGGTLVTVTGPTDARPSGGLTIDFCRCTRSRPIE
jgi:probable HAF family extracellular repeat protein